MKNTKKTSKKGSSALHRKNKRKGRLILWCVSFALAFIFWLYVAGTSDVPVEETFDLINIVYDDSVLAPHGLLVQSVSIDTVNVTIMGSQNDIRSARITDISAKISLKNITEPGEYSLPVDITTPDGTTVTHQTVSMVTVEVDRPSERVFNITSDSVEPIDYTLESDCYLGEYKLSEDVIVVKGPTLVLNTIKTVKIRTASIGSATDGKKVTAKVVFLDAGGKEINNNNITISDNANSLTVTLKVYMEKTVKLTASGEHGYFGENIFKVTPSEVTLVGSPEKLSKIDSINVFTIDETALSMDKNILEYKAEAYSLDGSITTKDGKSVIDGVSVDILVEDVLYQDITISSRDIEVDSTDGYKAADNIHLRVYFATSSNLNSVPGNAIIAYVDARDAEDATKDFPVIITITEAFNGQIYILDSEKPTVKITPPQIKDDAPSFDGEVNPLAD